MRDMQAAKNHRNAMRRVRDAGGRIAESLFDRRLCIMKYEEARRLSRETGIQYDVHHVHPVTHGGSHTPENLRVITHAENVRLSDTLPS